MTLRVPLTLTIIPALTVSIGNQHFAIPRSAIEEIVRANGTSVTLEKIGGAGVATIRGRRVPEVALADVLGLPSPMADEDRTLVVLRPAGGDVYALAVDKIHDHEELVVKPAAPAVMATGLYAGTTIADDGSPILLFDPAGLAEVGGVKLEAQERAARIAEGPAVAATRPPRSSCSAASTVRAERCACRSSTGSRKFRRARSVRAPASFESSSAKLFCRLPASAIPSCRPRRCGCSA
jgi:two-component system chemotaxis sensor kinase CheA